MGVPRFGPRRERGAVEGVIFEENNEDSKFSWEEKDLKMQGVEEDFFKCKVMRRVEILLPIMYTN